VLAATFGAGRAIYVGTRLGDDALAWLLGPVLGDGLDGLGGLTGVERVVRRSAVASYEFLINHTGQPARLTLASGGHELLSGTDVTGSLELGPQGVAVISREPGRPVR
jgi:beta-galactosidase